MALSETCIRLPLLASMDLLIGAAYLDLTPRASSEPSWIKKQVDTFVLLQPNRGNTRQMYLPETNILLTRFLQHDGVGELTDFMPVESDEAGYRPRRHQIIRMLSVIRGTVRFRIECAPAFNYGRDRHETEVCPKGIVSI